MTDSNWLASLKPGDEVAVGGGHYGYRLRKVDRITATQILVDARRFNRKSGWMCGRSNWNVTRIERPDAPHVLRDLDLARHANLRREIEAAAKKCDVAALEAALAVLKMSRHVTSAVPS